MVKSDKKHNSQKGTITIGVFLLYLGANLVQNFMKQHKLSATIFNFGETKQHNINDFSTILHNINGTPKTQRDNLSIISYKPCLYYRACFLCVFSYLKSIYI